MSLTVSRKGVYCNWHRHVEGFSRPTHAHIGIEVLLFESEGGFFRVAGNDYPISPGTILIFPATFPHHPFVYEDYERWNLCILPEYLEGEPALNRTVLFDRVDATTREKFALTFHHLTGALSHPSDFGDDQRVRSLLSPFATWVGDALVDGPTHRRGTTRPDPDGVSHRLIEYIEKHFQDHITLSSLARAVNYSPTQIWRIMRTVTGQTPMEYVNNRRLDHARRLLRRSDQSIASIAHMAGYRSASYFSRVFKQKTGFTPRQFRAYVKPSPSTPTSSHPRS